LKKIKLLFLISISAEKFNVQSSAKHARIYIFFKAIDVFRRQFQHVTVPAKTDGVEEPREEKGE
jgi:hypothetical protein